MKPLGNKTWALWPWKHAHCEKQQTSLSYLQPASAPWHTMETYFHHQPWEIAGAPGFNLKAQASCSSCLVSFVESSLLPRSRNLVHGGQQHTVSKLCAGPRRPQACTAPGLTRAARVSAEPRLNASLGVPLRAQTDCAEGDTQVADIEVVIMRTAGRFPLKWASEFPHN